MELYKNILVAVDLSDEAKEVVGKAVAICKQFQAAISVVHVVEPLVTETSYELVPVLSADVEQTLVERAEKFLSSLAKEFSLNDYNMQVKVGSVKTEIIEMAKEKNADLVMVGTHGRHGFALLLGSTANAILHGTPCDVLAVRVGGS